jgi:Ca2+-binding EF-hand superfamily protein
LWCLAFQISCVVVLNRNEDIASCFDRLDKDGNGVLSPEEVVSIIQDRMGFDEPTARQLVDMFDQNKDGSLDKTEFMQLWTSMFGQ